MMRNRSPRTILLFAAFSVLVLSCIDESITNIDSTTFYKASWSLPIGNTALSLEEVLDENGYIPSCNPSVVDSISSKWVSYDSCLIPNSDFPGVLLASYFENLDLSLLLENLEYAETITLRLNLSNELPYAGNFLIRLFDENGGFLFSLNDSRGFEMPPPSVDESGHISTPSVLQHDEVFEEDEIEDFMRVAQIQIYYELFRLINQPDLLYLTSDLALDIQMGIRAGLNIPLGKSGEE